MAKDDKHSSAPPAAANDNGTPRFDQARVDDEVIRVARLIGRQMAREAFQAHQPANDNAPPE